MITVTAHQIELLHHTLGVRPERREPHRNHFVAGPGHHDQADLEALEASGLMKRGRTPAFCDQTDVVFHVTDAGRAYAIDNLPPTPPPKKLSRYDEYRESECSEGFAWWLGINVPVVEMDYGWGSRKTWYRYVRRTAYRSDDVHGEWATTKKDAKASYKEALRERHAGGRSA